MAWRIGAIRASHWEARGYLGHVSKLAKVILALFGGAIGVSALGLLLLNMYVQSTSVQHRIELELSKALDVPVEIRRTSVSPLGGLTLAGVTIPAKKQEKPLLISQGVSANLRLLSLLAGRILIDEIALESPVVYWQQDDGKWKLPSRLKEEPIPVSQGVAAVTPAETETPAPAATLEPLESVEHARKDNIRVEVQRLRISDGKFDFLNEDGTGFARLEGVNVMGIISAKGDIAGEADTAQVTFVDRYVFTELKAPFTYQADALEIPSLTARMSDGTVRGKFLMEPVKEGTPLEMKLDFEDVNLTKLLVSAGVTSVRAAGTMNGFFELEGRARKRKDMAGRGSISVQNGQLDQYPLLQMIGRALRVDELDQMKLTTAEIRYTIDSGNIMVDSLVLKSQNIQVDAKGKIDRDNDLKLDARLILSQAITRQLPEFIEDNFAQVEGSDRRYLDFEIRGTVEKPKTNLVELALGRQLKKEAMDLIKSLWK